ncbi:hypothetical protein J2R98_002551 [Alkalibacillus filiformis]|uniref:DUF1616 domain-containing protein n=1 Tax=Alkalibacillus filiformis TaxID=200990 RepID=A0ABU0DWF7_9BACI|nr:hypothetical protein [Alkalibacillus filiformis]MDQ0352700.1 hypothetical protein [Alkalibacillus filiformis]
MGKLFLNVGVVVFFSLLTVALLLMVNDEGSPIQEGQPVSFELSGESEFWSLSRYQIAIEPMQLIAGDGVLTFKDDYRETDYFYYTVMANVNGEQQTISTTTVHMKDGNKIEIDEFEMGETKLGGYFYNVDGGPVTEEDIWQIYVILEWHDPNGEMVYDQILLYQSNV